MALIIDKRERPYHVGEKEFDRSEDISNLLPIWARDAGLELRSVTFYIDPVVLYDRFGFILHEWPCGFMSSRQDVYEVVNDILR